jgi:hypothetical protein
MHWLGISDAHVIKDKASNDINSSKYNSFIRKHEYFYNMYSFIPLHYQNLIK